MAGAAMTAASPRGSEEPVITILLVLSILNGGPQQRPPAPDDMRHETLWAVATIVAQSEGQEGPYRLYEPSRSGERRIVYVGVGFETTECSLGAYWTQATRAWAPLAWECP